MKIRIATVTMMIASLGMFAQEPSDTTRLMFGDTQVLVIDESDSDSTDVDWEDDDDCNDCGLTYWDGIDFGVNILLNKDGNTTFKGDDKWMELDYSESLSWRFNVIEQKIKLVEDYVGIVVGAGLTYNKYALKNNSTLVNQDDSTFAIPDTLINFSKNKLRATYIHVPLMLEFNTSKDCDKNFHLAVGVVGGLRTGSMTKQKYDYNNSDVLVKVKNDYNLTNLTLDASVRVGYRSVTLFATYGLTPLFEDKKGPEVYPMTVGICLVPFS